MAPNHYECWIWYLYKFIILHILIRLENTNVRPISLVTAVYIYMYIYSAIILTWQSLVVKMDKGSSNADDIGLVIVGRMGEEMGRAEKKEK